MKIQILSDIHLEFGHREFDFSGCDLLVLAGDIHVGLKGAEWILNEIKHIPVLYILGNHEYYRHDYPRLIQQLKNACENSNIHVLENDAVKISGVTFHGTTLWTDFELFGNPQSAINEAQKRMNDYNMIHRYPSNSRLSAVDTRNIHKDAVKWLDESLRSSVTQSNVVITHHAPSLQSIPLMFRTESIAAAFASDLEEFIKAHRPDLWIHGHLHKSFDYYIDKTRVICNPHGYPDEKIEGFNKELIIEINT